MIPVLKNRYVVSVIKCESDKLSLLTSSLVNFGALRSEVFPGEINYSRV